jgi:hypothetical protein
MWWEEPPSRWHPAFGWLDHELTPEFWADLFCRTGSTVSRPAPRQPKDAFEYYAASAFAWWLQVRDGLVSEVELLDTNGEGEPDCALVHPNGRLLVEVFAVYFPDDRLERSAAVHRLDNLVRTHFEFIPFPVTTEYASYRDLADDARLHRLAQRIGPILARQLLAKGTAEVDDPIRVKARRSEQAIIVTGTSDMAAGPAPRDAYTEQLYKELGQSRLKLARHSNEPGCSLVVTDHKTLAADQVRAAFRDVDPATYSETAGVFWFNASRRPFTLTSLYERSDRLY